MSKFAEGPIPLLGPVGSATAPLYPRYFICSGRRSRAGETATRTFSEESPADGNCSEPNASAQRDAGAGHPSPQTVSPAGAGRALESSRYSVPHSTATPDRFGRDCRNAQSGHTESYLYSRGGCDETPGRPRNSNHSLRSHAKAKKTTWLVFLRQAGRRRNRGSKIR